MVQTSLVSSWRCCAGDVVALGDGQVGPQKRDFQLQVGNTVLYNKFGLGVTDLDIQGVEHMLIKEDDCIGTMPRSGATADDIPELRPLGDRILVKVGPVPSVGALAALCGTGLQVLDLHVSLH